MIISIRIMLKHRFGKKKHLIKIKGRIYPPRFFFTSSPYYARVEHFSKSHLKENSKLEYQTELHIINNRNFNYKVQTSETASRGDCTIHLSYSKNDIFAQLFGNSYRKGSLPPLKFRKQRRLRFHIVCKKLLEHKRYYQSLVLLFKCIKRNKP